MSSFKFQPRDVRPADTVAVDDARAEIRAHARRHGALVGRGLLRSRTHLGRRRGLHHPGGTRGKAVQVDIRLNTHY